MRVNNLARVHYLYNAGGRGHHCETYKTGICNKRPEEITNFLGTLGAGRRHLKKSKQQLFRCFHRK